MKQCIIFTCKGGMRKDVPLCHNHYKDFRLDKPYLYVDTVSNTQLHEDVKSFILLKNKEKKLI